MQNAKTKMQTDKARFKQDFINRLIELTVRTLRFAEQLRKEKSLWPVADQLIRCTGSIGANVVEARGSSSDRDYTRFFEIALKSANETGYWLQVIRGYSLENEKTAAALANEVDEVTRIIGSSVKTLKSRMQ